MRASTPVFHDPPRTGREFGQARRISVAALALILLLRDSD
jgi:hypothetical protein